MIIDRSIGGEGGVFARLIRKVYTLSGKDRRRERGENHDRIEKTGLTKNFENGQAPIYV